MAARDFTSELVGSFSEGSNGNPTVAMIEAALPRWRPRKVRVAIDRPAPQSGCDAVSGTEIT